MDFAVRLSAGTTEIELRTSVGRAYYGAFHTAMQLLFDIGVRMPRGPEAHQKLGFCLTQCGEPAGVRAGARLTELRKKLCRL